MSTHPTQTPKCGMGALGAFQEGLGMTPSSYSGDKYLQATAEDRHASALNRKVWAVLVLL
eukprot:37897-Chlamydomonas_euryale.AAC.7